jgi:hypothetical protein
MKSFDQWKFEQTEPSVSGPQAADQTLSRPEGSEPASTAVSAATSTTPSPKMKIKPWKASKEDILNFWRGIGANIPLQLKTIDYDHEGSTIQEDGIRITGSKEFITSVLSRLKDFLTYENPESKLMVAYRQSPKSFVPGNKNSYIFYLQAKKRGKNA